ncbi:DUF2058 domain-containing protein [Pseudomonadota bacterium]
MGNSLQDQLKALGLAKEQKPASKQQPKHALAKPRPKPVHRDRKNPGELSLEKAFALRKQEEKRQAEETRRIKIEEDRQRKLLNNAIRQIVKAHRLNLDDAELARNFMFRGRIRKIHVTPEQLKALNAGELGIVYLSGGYHLLAREHTDAVRLLSETHVPDLSVGTDDDDEEFPVPDDLIW